MYVNISKPRVSYRYGQSDMKQYKYHVAVEGIVHLYCNNQ